MFYTIGEMAQKLDVAPSTLRYYDKEGLLPFVERSSGGIRMFKDEDMLDVRVIAYYEIPKSVSKKKRKLMLEHRIRPTKKPDWDNIGKIICDSLNKVAYHDDAAVVDAQVRKFYSEQPRVDVTIRVVRPNEI